MNTLITFKKSVQLVRYPTTCILLNFQCITLNYAMLHFRNLRIKESSFAFVVVYVCYMHWNTKYTTTTWSFRTFRLDKYTLLYTHRILYIALCACAYVYLLNKVIMTNRTLFNNFAEMIIGPCSLSQKHIHYINTHI